MLLLVCVKNKKRLLRAVKKYGKENFKCEILEFFESREEVLRREKEFVNEQLINDSLCMNLQPGGGGGFLSKEHGLKCSSAGGKSYREKLYSDKKFFKTVSKRSSEVSQIKNWKEKFFLWYLLDL